MIHDDNTFFQDTQFTLSHELIFLLRWLTVHDQERLKKIIDRALAAGLQQELKREITNSKHKGFEEDAHNNIIDFLGMLETTLFEAINEQTVKQALQKNLMPSIDQIDTSVCDDATVRFSVEKATSTHNTHENPKDLLLKELLKRWKPSKKNILN